MSQRTAFEAGAKIVRNTLTHATARDDINDYLLPDVSDTDLSALAWQIAVEVIDAAAPHLKAEALREAAEEWQVNGWHEDMPRGTGRISLILGMAQRAATFLRSRADRVERGEA